MPVDQLLVSRKIALILGDLKELERLGDVPRDEFLANRTHQLVAERLLEVMIGRMIDINYHLITERDGLPPKDFYESFTKLAPLDILPPELASAMAPAAGLRNRLAHEYNEMDYGKLYEAISDALQKVPQYLEAVEASLER